MCDECIDAVKENPFTGDGARFVNIESVLKSLDKRVTELEREATSPQPQPRTPRLVGACEKLISRCQIIADDEQCDCGPEGHICGLPNFRREIDNVRLALAAEKKRQELRDAVIQAARVQQLEPEVMDAPCGCRTCAAIDALDAFEKGEAQ